MSAGTNHSDKHKLIGFVALIFGCFATYVILTYALENLDTLGLSPKIRSARSYDIYLLVFVHVFLFFIGGVIAYSHPSLRFWLMLLAVAIFVYDFGGTFQARMGIVQQQTLTQDAQKTHADLLAGQISASQGAAKQLQQSAARQLANKHITGSAGTAKEAARQADNGAKLVEAHAKTIENIHPTEKDTWGEWTTQKMFAGALLVHLVNFAMWTLAGVMFGAGNAHASTETPAPVHDRSTFAGRAAAAGVVGGAALGGVPAHAETPQTAKTVTPMTVSYRGVIPSVSGVSQGAGVSISKHQNSEGVSESKQEDRGGVLKTKRQSKRVAGGADTGTTGETAHRYSAVKQAVKDGLKPSVRAIQAKFGGSPGVLIGYLKQLESEGVTVRDGRGWKVVNHA
jgi:hypothetical protein